MFARSDKWLPSLPTIDFSAWKDRISEALGFLTWMEKLTSWVGLGSEVFPDELMHAVKTQDESRLKQDRLTVEQQKRSTRLMHILRQTLASHEKSSLILQTYVESESTYQQSGFVALRLLAKGFCLKSRAECLYFRSQLVNQTVKAPSVPEIVCKIEHEMNKDTKLLNSLDSDVHAGGLQIQEADSVMVLLRSLPDKCRSHCLLHGNSESFEDLKRVALKFEVQQRVWSEAPGTKLQPFREPIRERATKKKGKAKERNRKESVIPAKVLENDLKARARKMWSAMCVMERDIMHAIVGTRMESQPTSRIPQVLWRRPRQKEVPRRRLKKESRKARERAKGRQLLKSPKMASLMTIIWLEVSGMSLSQRPEWNLYYDLSRTC